MKNTKTVTVYTCNCCGKQAQEGDPDLPNWTATRWLKEGSVDNHYCKDCGSCGRCQAHGSATRHDGYARVLKPCPSVGSA